MGRAGRKQEWEEGWTFEGKRQGGLILEGTNIRYVGYRELLSGKAVRAGRPCGCSDSLAFPFPSLSSKSARPQREPRRSLGECGEDWLEHSAEGRARGRGRAMLLLETGPLTF